MILFSLNVLNTENTISKAKNVLIVLPESDKNQELQELMVNFCGTVVKNCSKIEGDCAERNASKQDMNGKKLHLCPVLLNY